MYVPLIHYGKNDEESLVGLLHLVNRDGGMNEFERDDACVNIVVHQAAGVLTGILERQVQNRLSLFDIV